MEGYTGCIYRELNDGTLLLSNVAFKEYVIPQIYLGTGGVCCVAGSDDMPEDLFSGLRDLLGTARVLLFLGHEKRYDPLTGSLIAINGDETSLGREILSYLHEVTPFGNTTEKMRRMRDCIIETDARTRGYYRDEDGTLYILRHGRFQTASETDPDRQFFLTLFGGFLGLHRFAMGKYISGLFYLLTCGVFLAGWLMDLLQLFLGVQRERDKSLILPLQNRGRKLLLVLPGLAAGMIALVIYAQIFGSFLGSGFLNDPSAMTPIANRLLHLFSNLAELSNN